MCLTYHLLYIHIKVFIDSWGGKTTAGQSTPKGRFSEYKLNRAIASELASAFRSIGLDAEFLVPDENDIILAEWCRRVNAWCWEHGKDSCLLISIYSNAFGNCKEWTSPSGWSEYTSKGQTRADKFADCLFSAVKKYLPLMKMHTNWSDSDADLEESFYILKQTLHLAALTENCFMTNA